MTNIVNKHPLRARLFGKRYKKLTDGYTVWYTVYKGIIYITKMKVGNHG